MIICRPAEVSVRECDVFGLTLMSDLHIGAPNIDYGLISEELSRAKEKQDRILLNGDIFDMILPGDIKRFSPTALHPRLQGRDDVVNGQVEWAEELLAPYARQIDMIGTGNHEAVIAKYRSFDPIVELVKRLSKRTRHLIYYGGYTGMIDYRFRQKHATHRYIVYYHHGAGGDAPITGGMIDAMRKGWVDANVRWEGHRHSRWARTIQAVTCPTDGYEPVMKDINMILTGSYFDTYRGQIQADMTSGGRRSNYAADRGMAPQGKGGMRIELEFLPASSSKPYRVRVIQ